MRFYCVFAFLTLNYTKLFTIFVSFSKFTVFRSRTLAGNNVRTMRKEITTSLPDEELRAKTIEISSEAAQSEMDKKKSSLRLFLTRVKIFLLKRKKYDIQTLV